MHDEPGDPDERIPLEPVVWALDPDRGPDPALRPLSDWQLWVRTADQLLTRHGSGAPPGSPEWAVDIEAMTLIAAAVRDVAGRAGIPPADVLDPPPAVPLAAVYATLTAAHGPDGSLLHRPPQARQVPAEPRLRHAAADRAAAVISAARAAAGPSGTLRTALS